MSAMFLVLAVLCFLAMAAAHGALLETVFVLALIASAVSCVARG